MREYNLFISHAWRYSAHYDKVVEWLDIARVFGRLSYKNYSASKDDPLVELNQRMTKSELRAMLENQIRPSSVVIILAGMYAAYSEWIDFEIDTAVKMRKYIIGVEPWGQERIPLKIQANKDIMVGWNGDSVINAILNSGRGS